MVEQSKPKSPRSTRAKAKAGPAKGAVEDAVVVEMSDAETATGAVAEPAADDTPEVAQAPVEAETTSDEIASDQTTETSAEAEATADVAADSEPPVEEPSTEEPHSAAPPPPVLMPVAEQPRRGGFLPMFLGGIIAAGLGAGGLYLANDRGWLALGSGTDALEATVAKQTDLIEELQTALVAARGEIESLQGAMPDGAALTASIAETGTAASAARAELAGTIATLQTRIEQVETQPIPKAELPAEVVAAYEARLTEMMGTVDSRFGAMQTALDAKLAEIATAQAAALETEADATKAAEIAGARAAMSRVTIALDSGAGFADDLQQAVAAAGLDAPAALSAVAADGVPTLATLKDSFPDLARTALKAATSEAAAAGEVSGLSAFLRNQLGARSLAPREGNDPDAVLSRAEAAVGGGNLDTALAEITTLPQVAQDVLADWVMQATSRRAALAAAADLTAQLNN